MKVKSLSRVRPSATPWTAAFQAPLSMGFSRQEYWSGVPLPSLFPLCRVRVIALVPCPLQVILRIKCNRNYERRPNALCIASSRFAVKQGTNSGPIDDCRRQAARVGLSLSGPYEAIWSNPQPPMPGSGILMHSLTQKAFGVPVLGHILSQKLHKQNKVHRNLSPVELTF